MSSTFPIQELWSLVSYHLDNIADKMSLMMTCKYIYSINSNLDHSIKRFRKLVEIASVSDFDLGKVLEIIAQRFSEGKDQRENLSLASYMDKMYNGCGMSIRHDLTYTLCKINKMLLDDANKLIDFYRSIGYKHLDDFTELFCRVGYEFKLPGTGRKRVLAFLIKNREYIEGSFWSVGHISVLEVIEEHTFEDVDKKDWLLMLE